MSHKCCCNDRTVVVSPCNTGCANSGYGNYGCGFGGSWIIILILLLCGGCGNNGFGCGNNCGCGNNGCNNGCGFGSWWIIILILLLCGGCGNNGFGC